MALVDYFRPSSVTVIPQSPTPLLDSWRLDAATAQSMSHPGSVSRHPVQSGREGITDAVDIDPPVLSVSGILTDTPLAFGIGGFQQDRAALMYDLLEKLRAQRQPLTVITSWTGERANLWISEFTASKSAGTGRSIEISMTIEKLNIVRTQLLPSQVDSDIQLLGVSTVTVGEF